MKLTKSKLKEIIREEILKEGSFESRVEFHDKAGGIVVVRPMKKGDDFVFLDKKYVLYLMKVLKQNKAW
jgi:hypothetical protein